MTHKVDCTDAVSFPRRVQAMSTPRSENTEPHIGFVRELRHRAENAAAASVHHASLSQQYLDLSQRFARLAEQANAANIPQLQESLRQIEAFSTSVNADATIPVDTIPASIDSAMAVRSASTESKPEDQPTSVQSAAAVRTATGSSASGTPAQQPFTRPGRWSTRALVARVRAAKLAGRRVRVHARKADLKPKQRTATEEIQRNKSSIATSSGLCAVAVLLLSRIVIVPEPESTVSPIIASFTVEPQEEETQQPIEIPEEPEPESEPLDAEAQEPVDDEPDEPEPVPEDPVEALAEAEIPAEPMVEDVPSPESMPTDLPAENNSVDMATIDNRSAEGRMVLLQKYGGSEASESAVQRALEWLISVQHPDGYWDFSLPGPAGNPGRVINPIGGTAYALLPFLAAGQTHRSGEYRQQVGAGLSFLVRIGHTTPAGYDLRGVLNKGNKDREPNEAYYVHGAATLVLCEAYQMTKDRKLKVPAQAAVRFLINSQDPRGGGWRYVPQEPGSTSVTAVATMALMAARKAGISVPEATFRGIEHYLDSVRVDGQGRYGYEVQKKTYKGSLTAMALLCRMYLGWGRADGDLHAGIRLLDKAGPYNNLYSNYFATQVMRHWGGEEWERWNLRLRDDLIRLQETEGPGKGSWAPRDRADYSQSGGRLLTTSLAALTLQVYYRHKPLLPEK